jgi:hypothetical protein
MEASANTPGGESGDESPARPDAPARPPAGRGTRITAYVAAAALALGAGFGLTKLITPPRVPSPPSAIPAPARSGGVFVEDDNGTGQDNESNILQATAHGLVHLLPAGRPAGIGLVLTPSGKVLTTYQPRAGETLSASYVLSGDKAQATVLGTDPADGLALLQLQGGGRTFSTVQVGNSDLLAANANAVKQLSYHLPGEVFDTAVGTAGTGNGVIIDTGVLVALNQSFTVNGSARTGLMQSRLQSVSASAVGGPLVNLNGQVIGITLAGGGSGLKISSYAMPINQALAIARQIDARARHTS